MPFTRTPLGPNARGVWARGGSRLLSYFKPRFRTPVAPPQRPVRAVILFVPLLWRRNPIYARRLRLRLWRGHTLGYHQHNHTGRQDKYNPPTPQEGASRKPAYVIGVCTCRTASRCVELAESPYGRDARLTAPRHRPP